MTWINQVGVDTYVVITSAAGDLKSIDNIMNLGRDIKVPEQGPGSTSNMANKIVWTTLDAHSPRPRVRPPTRSLGMT